MEILELLRPGVTKPHVDHAARASWLAAVHEAMRSVSGAVVAAAEEPAVGRNYYRVGVEARDGVVGVILFNAAALLVAAAEAVDPQKIAMVFAAVPEVGSSRTENFRWLAQHSSMNHSANVICTRSRRMRGVMSPTIVRLDSEICGSTGSTDARCHKAEHGGRR